MAVERDQLKTSNITNKIPSLEDMVRITLNEILECIQRWCYRCYDTWHKRRKTITIR